MPHAVTKVPLSLLIDCMLVVLESGGGLLKRVPLVALTLYSKFEKFLFIRKVVISSGFDLLR